jgi:hypothetical protein
MIHPFEKKNEAAAAALALRPSQDQASLHLKRKSDSLSDSFLWVWISFKKELCVYKIDFLKREIKKKPKIEEENIIYI